MSIHVHSANVRVQSGASAAARGRRKEHRAPRQLQRFVRRHLKRYLVCASAGEGSCRRGGRQLCIPLPG